MLSENFADLIRLEAVTNQETAGLQSRAGAIVVRPRIFFVAYSRQLIPTGNFWIDMLKKIQETADHVRRLLEGMEAEDMRFANMHTVYMREKI